MLLLLSLVSLYIFFSDLDRNAELLGKPGVVGGCSHGSGLFGAFGWHLLISLLALVSSSHHRGGMGTELQSQRVCLVRYLLTSDVIAALGLY